jgi:hypothetical protein
VLILVVEKINNRVNYQKIYDSLISRARNRVLEGYTEKHHIIPKCLDGTDDAANLVALTAEEHFLAHQLLVKLHPENRKLIFAAHMMTRSNGKNPRNNKEYSWLRKRRSELISKSMKGVKRGKYVKDKRLDPYEFSIAVQIILNFGNEVDEA